MTHFIVIPPNQREDAVVRRVVGYARQAGEAFNLDRNMPSARIAVGPKTLALWKAGNAVRAEADAAGAEAHAAAVATRRAEAEAAAAPEPESVPDPEPEVEDKAPAKRSAKKQTSRKAKA
jgi:hypothetical protein